MPHHKDGLLRVPEADLAELPTYPNPKTGSKRDTHKAKHKDLFAKPPAIDDIVQGPIGDCYLLAVLSAILDSPGGPDKIENMMQDTGEHIVVRFYKQNLQPVYIKVEKSVVHTWLSSAQKRADGPLWVLMMEKAFTVFLGTESDGKVYKDYYKQLLGGGNPPDKALRALLGAVAETLNCKDEGLTSLIKLWGEAPKFEPDDALCAAMLAAWDGAAQADKLNAWKTWARQTLVDLIDGLKKPRVDAFLEWFDAQVKRQPLDPEVANAFKIFLHANQLLPGKRGSGVYSEHMLKTYNKIRTALDQGLMVATYTKPGIGGSGAGKGTVGETFWKGLFAEHAYAILGAEEKPIPHNPGRNLLMVCMRNPHGAAGRRYEWKEKHGHIVLTALETKDGKFWLELSDLIKRFQAVYIGKEARDALIGDD